MGGGFHLAIYATLSGSPSVLPVRSLVNVNELNTVRRRETCSVVRLPGDHQFHGVTRLEFVTSEFGDYPRRAESDERVDEAVG